MQPALTPLAEWNGTVKAPGKITRQEVEYAVDHYGDYIIVTEHLDLYDLDHIRTSYLDILGDQASLTKETIEMQTLQAGTNVVYADGATDSATAQAKTITRKDIKLVSLKLRKQAGKKFTRMVTGTTKVGSNPIRAAYVGICDPSIVEDLESIPGFTITAKYPSGQLLDPNEVGELGGIRWIENTLFEPSDLGGGKLLYKTLVMAKDAFATTTLRGHGTIAMVTTDIGTASKSDPLAQFGTLGWKAIFGCAILNQAWLVRIESGSANDLADAKHYMDV